MEPWFVKKEAGYGMKPSTKEGWMVIFSFVFLSGFSVFMFISQILPCGSNKACANTAVQNHIGWFILIQVVLTAALLAILLKKTKQ